jgi:hypothetical protein
MIESPMNVGRRVQNSADRSTKPQLGQRASESVSWTFDWADWRAAAPALAVAESLNKKNALWPVPEPTPATQACCSWAQLAHRKRRSS